MNDEYVCNMPTMIIANNILSKSKLKKKNSFNKQKKINKQMKNRIRKKKKTSTFFSI